MKVNQILLVDHNSARATQAIKKISEAGIADNIKFAVNGEHALLCLDHLDLYQRIKDKVVIVLSLDHSSPAYGSPFLEPNKLKKYSGNENILVVVSEESSSPEQIEKAKASGVAEFVSSHENVQGLSEIIKRRFTPKLRERVTRVDKKLSNQTISIN